MAGHSQFKNIMHRKGRQDALRAKKFTRLLKEVQVAARDGLPDPSHNARLRSAIQAARAGNVPNANIDRAIKKGQSNDFESFEEVRYEGYGPGGAAIIVEALTDNRNRTASEVRAAFSKFGGSLGESNSVSFQFQRIGEIHFAADAADDEAMLEAAINEGASDCVSGDLGHGIICEPADLATIRDSMEARFGPPERAALTWRPKMSVPVPDENVETLIKLLNILDDNDDVQQVVANFEISDEAMLRANS